MKRDRNNTYFYAYLEPQEILRELSLGKNVMIIHHGRYPWHVDPDKKEKWSQ